MDFLKNCIRGMAIGVGAIVPGVSSGVICVILGIYEKILEKVLNIFKDFKKSIKFLFPIAIGVVIGAVTFGNILNYLFYQYPLQTKFTFIGLILGCIPLLLKEVNKKKKFKLHYILYLVVSALVGVGMVFLENNIQTTNTTELSFCYLTIAGLIMSIGVVIPGVSSTVILMLMGVYSTYLTAVAQINFNVLIPMGIGLIIGGVICMKLTKILLDKFYIQTFYSIIGFTIGSVLVLYPGFIFDINGLIAVLCFILGFLIANNFG